MTYCCLEITLIKNAQLLVNIPTTELITSMCYVPMVPTGKKMSCKQVILTWLPSNMDIDPSKWLSLGKKCSDMKNAFQTSGNQIVPICINTIMAFFSSLDDWLLWTLLKINRHANLNITCVYF